jgi:hypothetical protein
VSRQASASLPGRAITNVDKPLLMAWRMTIEPTKDHEAAAEQFIIIAFSEK